MLLFCKQVITMHIIVGSTNKAKIQAVSRIFSSEYVTSFKAPSNVSKQPFSDAETRRGAINRAIFSQQSTNSKDDVGGIGLEGGVMSLGDHLYLCNWGALALPNGEVIDASGVRILLPQRIVNQLKAGQELGEIMATLTNDQEIRQKTGAVGVLTANYLTREQIYGHIVQLLKGQLEFQQQILEAEN